MSKYFNGFRGAGATALRSLALAATLAGFGTVASAQSQAASDGAARVETVKPSGRAATAQARGPYEPIKIPAEQAAVPELQLFVGESMVFPAPRVARVAVGKKDVLSAAVLDEKEVIIFGDGVGTTTLFIWHEDGRHQRVKVQVIAGDIGRIAREISAFLATIPTVKTSIIGDKVIVEGEDLSDLDIAKIDELAKRYPQIVNFTNRLGWEQMVFMDVKVVEFPRNKLREIGLRWNAAGGAAFGTIWSPVRYGDEGPFQIDVPPGTGSPPPITDPNGNPLQVPSPVNILSVVNMGITAQLNLLAQQGEAAILAEPQLSARSGTQASFLAGGEFPYSVITELGPQVLFKPFGVKLDILPRVTQNGVIRATIATEVSQIDTSISTPAGPGLSTRKTSTEFNVRNGETLVLGGLLSRRHGVTVDKLPVLGDIPILGALFRSKRFQDDETELVVFVTPTIVDSRSPGLVNRIEQAHGRLQKQLGPQPYLSRPLQPNHDAAQPAQTPPPVPPASGPEFTLAPPAVQAVNPGATEAPVR